jgi:hypothetical protein
MRITFDRERKTVGPNPVLYVVVALWGVLSATRTVVATDVTTCGTTVAPGDTAVLVADLDCPTSSFAIRMLPQSTLELNGHRIGGGDSTFATVLGVARIHDEDPPEGGRGNFAIRGPGEIYGVSHAPILSTGTQGCVALQDGRAEITSATGVVDIHDCVFGVVGYLLEYSTNKARATLDHVVLHDNGLEGVTVRKLSASNVESYGNGGIGVHAINRMDAMNVFSHGNAVGLFATRTVRGGTVMATDNGIGVSSFGSIALTDVTVTGNDTFGVRARRVMLTGGTVTGNSSADIASDRPPQLVSVTCGTSLQPDTSSSWGVCADD